MSEISDFKNVKNKRRSHAFVGSDPTLLALGDRIRSARVEVGMTQEELALVTGVGRDRIMQLEGGRPGIAIGKVVQILALLGLKFIIEKK